MEVRWEEGGGWGEVLPVADEVCRLELESDVFVSLCGGGASRVAVAVAGDDVAFGVSGSSLAPPSCGLSLHCCYKVTLRINCNDFMKHDVL